MFGDDNPWTPCEEFLGPMVASDHPLRGEIISPIALAEDGSAITFCTVEKAFRTPLLSEEPETVFVPAMRLVLASPCGHYNCGYLPLEVCLN